MAGKVFHVPESVVLQWAFLFHAPFSFFLLPSPSFCINPFFSCLLLLYKLKPESPENEFFYTTYGTQSQFYLVEVHRVPLKECAKTCMCVCLNFFPKERPIVSNRFSKEPVSPKLWTIEKACFRVGGSQSDTTSLYKMSRKVKLPETESRLVAGKGRDCQWTWGFLRGRLKCSKIRWCCWLYNSINLQKIVDAYT